jgi:hypothetical protein
MRILKSIVPAPQETITQCPERRSMMRMTFAKAPPSPPSQQRAGSGGIGLCCVGTTFLPASHTQANANLIRLERIPDPIYV